MSAEKIKYITNNIKYTLETLGNDRYRFEKLRNDNQVFFMEARFDKIMEIIEEESKEYGDQIHSDLEDIKFIIRLKPQVIGVVLTKLNSNHNNLRTTQINGFITKIPKQGESLILYAKPLIKGTTFRCIQTTPMISIERIDKVSYLLKTHNSLYRLYIKN